MAERKAAAPQNDEAARVYPNIESFLESNDRSAIEATFGPTREALAQLPKPKAEQGKRALKAVQLTESLLDLLFKQKDQLVADAKAAKKTRR